MKVWRAGGGQRWSGSRRRRGDLRDGGGGDQPGHRDRPAGAGRLRFTAAALSARVGAAARVRGRARPGPGVTDQVVVMGGLDRAARGDRRRRAHERHLGRRGDGACASQRRDAPGSAGGGSRPTQAEPLARQRPERADGDERGHAPAHAAQAVAVLAAAGAVAHMAPRQAGGAHAAVAGQRQVLADGEARGVTCLRRVDQASARPHEQRLHGGHAHPEGERRAPRSSDPASRA